MRKLAFSIFLGIVINLLLLLIIVLVKTFSLITVLSALICIGVVSFTVYLLSSDDV